MAEHEFEVKTVMVKLVCDKCKGEMEPTGICLTSLPPQWPHQCKDCGGAVNISGKRYPYTKYEPI